jgi:predicted nucleic acid-binding protein
VIVVDASAVLDLLLRTGRAERLDKRLLRDGLVLSAPHLIDIEVAQVLRRYAAARGADLARLEEALHDYRELPIERYAHELLLPRIWELRGQLTAYDAPYIALAELLGCRLVTCDARLAASSGHKVKIDLIQ